MLFTEVPFLDRFERAAKAGFKAVEFLFPYAIRQRKSGAARCRTGCSWCCTTCRPATGTRVSAASPAIPDRVEEFRAGVAQAIEYATALGVPQLNCLAGKAPGDVGPDLVRRTFVENLRFAAGELKRAGLRLLIEPINTYDIPGFYLNRTDQALAILDEVGADNAVRAVRHLPRAAHGRRTGGDAASAACRASATCSWPTTRVATSRAPARSTTPSCSHTSTRIGYRGWIGCEYKPVAAYRGRPRLAPAARRLTAASPQENLAMTSQSLKLGFIGLGIMGAPMAGHLIKAGHQLFVHTHRQGAAAGGGHVGAPFAPARAAWPNVPTSSSSWCPTRPTSRRCCSRENGVAAGLSKGKVVVDMSSISPIATKAFAQQINQAGCDYLDAPVSGGEVGAKNATLSIMVGGTQATFDRVKPLFELMGKNITLVGGNGDGQTAKVANQIIVALTIEAVGEALLLAARAGADPARVRQALMGGFASSQASSRCTAIAWSSAPSTPAFASSCTRRT